MIIEGNPSSYFLRSHKYNSPYFRYRFHFAFNIYSETNIKRTSSKISKFFKISRKKSDLRRMGKGTRLFASPSQRWNTADERRRKCERWDVPLALSWPQIWNGRFEAVCRVCTRCIVYGERIGADNDSPLFQSIDEINEASCYIYIPCSVMDSRKGIEIERKFAFVFRERLVLIRFLLG